MVRNLAELGQVAQSTAEHPVVAEWTRHGEAPDLEKVCLAEIIQTAPRVSLAETIEIDQTSKRALDLAERVEAGLLAVDCNMAHRVAENLEWCTTSAAEKVEEVDSHELGADDGRELPHGQIIRHQLASEITVPRQKVVDLEILVQLPEHFDERLRQLAHILKTPLQLEAWLPGSDEFEHSRLDHATDLVLLELLLLLINEHDAALRLHGVATSADQVVWLEFERDSSARVDTLRVLLYSDNAFVVLIRWPRLEIVGIDRLKGFKHYNIMLSPGNLSCNLQANLTLMPDHWQVLPGQVVVHSLLSVQLSQQSRCFSATHIPAAISSLPERFFFLPARLDIVEL